MKSSEVRVLDETVAQFQESSDVADALDMWLRGFYSDAELVDRLKLEAQYAKGRAERLILGPSDEKTPLSWSDGFTKEDDEGAA